MKINRLKPRKALNRAFLKVKSNRSEIERFKTNLIQLLDRTNDTESEEFHKNLVSDFLKKTYYDPHHFINTKGRNDLVIHNGDKAKSSVGVILEAKKPTNRSEMVTPEKLNTKAFQELALYYLRERITHKNLEVKHLVITNINEWYIFDATTFDRLFAQNKNFVKQFNDFEAGRMADTKTDFFYKQIAEPFIESITSEIEFTHFNLQDYINPLRNADKADDHALITLFKLLSPEHLLKLPFTNDSNSLDRRFYSELLHIIGLTETKEGSKKLIGRNKAGERNTGSILEDTVIQLDSLDKLNQLKKPSQYGHTQEERLFNVALELSITWINRILFLKLLEAQLIAYHKQDPSQAFLKLDRIKDFDGLNTLFFQILARKKDERNEDVIKLFEKVPYLNSSLFEPTELEHATLFISNLKDNKTIPIISTTVLKDQQGKKRTGHLSTLEYLFAFLEAYDFGAEGGEDIQEDNKTLINASVLGLIFEKINGYKDGSFFTPGFITMYMCRETIRKAVVQKFNDAKQWRCQTIDDLYDKIEDRQEANDIVNSLKICDPAVGSGHFLVSALNEMLAVKNDLKILQDRDGKRLKEYLVEVVNDELIVTDEEGELFEYNPSNIESQRIQETLFHEKQTIIENCLFGVDINANSVKICRLRLWIELLKNAYYKTLDLNPRRWGRELETLPNIDINIKCGNSLVSRFPLDQSITHVFKHGSKWTIDSYRIAVATYRNAESKEQKREMERLIAHIKSDFRSEITLHDPKAKKLRKLSGELFQMTQQTQLFEMNPKEKAAWNKKVQQLTKDIKKIEDEIEAIKANKIYENAFEWRFEFPEVLNDDGDFVGFDVVIGNPPYIRQEEFSELKPYLKSRFKIYHSIADLLTYFVELSYDILKTKGSFQFIISNKFTRANYGQVMRKYLLENTTLTHFLDFSGVPVFDEATVDAAILGFNKINSAHSSFIYANIAKDKIDTQNFKNYLNHIEVNFNQESLNENAWSFENQDVLEIKTKVEAQGIPLKEWDIRINRGILTGLNEAFVIDGGTKDKLIAEDVKSAEIIKPLLRGRDIQKWQADFQELWIISTFPSRSYNINDFPAIKNHLLSFGKRLEQSGEKGSRKKTTNKWFEIQDNIAYWQDFEKPKIIYKDISQNLTFAYDTDCKYINNTCYFFTSKKENYFYLIAILNSKLIDFYYKLISTQLGEGAVRLFTQFFEKIPIKQISEIEETPFKELVNQILSLKKQNPTADTTDIETQIDQLVYRLYDLTEEEIKIIENG